MIVTVTPNTGIDYTLQIPSWAPNATLRSSGQAWGMGGKATDAAWILGKLGAPVRALGCAAGENGRRMDAMLRERGVETDFVWVAGETRLNVVVVCADGSGQSTLTSSTLEVSPAQMETLIHRSLAALEGASCLVLGGSLPNGIPADAYNPLIAAAHRRGLPVIFDASGPALRAGLQARPSLVKPNRDELSELLGCPPVNFEETLAGARRLQAEYGCDVIATLGSDGALAVLGERAFRIPALRVPVASAAGAGDGVLAGMALALERGEPPEQGLRYGFALAAAILQTLATADFHLEDYERCLREVVVLPLP